MTSHYSGNDNYNNSSGKVEIGHFDLTKLTVADVKNLVEKEANCTRFFSNVVVARLYFR